VKTVKIRGDDMKALSRGTVLGLDYLKRMLLKNYYPFKSKTGLYSNNIQVFAGSTNRCF
jgi:hypothetical protein